MLLLTVSFGKGQELVQVKLKTGNTVTGDFVGTYMEYLHLLIGENINYFKCDDIQSVTKNHIYSFDYDCSKNTVTADILFPPQLNPMTGEWETITPDVFDPEKVLKKQLKKTKSTFQEVVSPKIKAAISNAFYEGVKEEPYQDNTQTNEGGGSSSSTTNNVSKPQKEIKDRLATYYYEDGTVSFSEDEIRNFIKNEVRKEIRKTLPYEIRKHKEQKQNKLFQNILLGCGAWFLFMIMLS